MQPSENRFSTWEILIIIAALVVFAFLFLNSGSGAHSATAPAQPQLSSTTQQFIQQNVDLAKWIAKEYPAQN